MTAKKMTFTFSEEEAKALEGLSESLHLKKTEIVRRAIAMYEDYVDLADAKKRFANLENGKSEVIDLEELERRVYAD